MKNALRMAFVCWYSCGLVLMLTIGVPSWLLFSNGLFLVLYAVYALQIEAELGEPAGLRIVRAIGIGGAAFLAEWIGVASGKPFGTYSYTSELGFLVGGVPITMTCAWVGVVTSAVMLAEGSGSRAIRAVKAGLWTVALDLVLDPVAFARGFWIWGNHGGASAGGESGLGSLAGMSYYGIPFANFASWFCLTALLSFCYPLRGTGTAARTENVRLMQLMLLMFGLLGMKAGQAMPPILAAAACLILERKVRRDPRSQKLVV